MVHLENEILDVLKSIRNDKNNQDKYGQVGISHYSESILKTKLSPEAFEYLSKGKSAYGVLQTYGGRFGTYKALWQSNKFFQDVK
jgi:hypothetical protein